MVPVFKENDPADNDIVKKIAVFENTIYGKISNSSLQRIPNDYYNRTINHGLYCHTHYLFQEIELD